ncbi:matrix-remodeling-associated protein 7-like [Cimex lectularius]|uniref:Matrix-remodeling-associated protein 7 helical domain-containing protein n=1 Tax=Cimex lectularius TaxID=79782 RepID=A0A8I6RDK1_CIMLE|nr:matrix-remodeling-associated protein 7-like [Cimex lectularius]
MLGYLMPFYENVMIYYENISYFYILCITVSFIAVGICWTLEGKENHRFDKGENDENQECSEEEKGDEAENDTSRSNSASGLVTSKTPIEQIAQNLSQIDLEQEKEIEKEQLKSIFKLLQQDRDKFQIESLQELEEQMKLYRE